MLFLSLSCLVIPVSFTNRVLDNVLDIGNDLHQFGFHDSGQTGTDTNAHSAE